jgi:hypothetical protein
MSITDVNVVYEKEHAWINYNESGRYIIMIWTTSPSSREYRESMEALIEAMRQFKTGRLIVDNRKAGALHPDDRSGPLKIGMAAHWRLDTRMLLSFNHPIFFHKYQL